MNVLFSFKQVQTALVVLVMMLCSLPGVMADTPPLSIQDLGEGHCLVRIHTNQRYVLLPVEEVMPDVRVSMIVNNQEVKNFDVRLAVNRVDYFVPLDLAGYAGKEFLLKFKLSSNDPVRGQLSAVCCKEMKLSDTFDTANREKFRPTYHFSPLYGWMNDPNGMVYKDGEYHLFYQYNPYGSKWGNMSWGHAISKDLVHWDHRPVAIAPDALGTIFSGSAVVDAENTAGFGAGAIVAIYTQSSDRQVQSIAYSTDNGRTFTKYEHNPVLVSDVRDFRDPKVFWHKETQRWVMILAVGQEMQLFSSPNLKDWTHESRFGEGQGAHGGVWECPDLFELPVEGTDERKWVLLGNLNPGGPFGGSATQYFVGSFDGKTFVNESPATTKWMDWGKDHYATVTWSDAPDHRRIALAWMSNWQYANDVPTTQYRSPNSVPRDLSLFIAGNGETYLQSAPSPELKTLRRDAKKRSFAVKGQRTVKDMISGNDGSYEIELTIKPQRADVVGFRLYNDKGEEVTMQYDMQGKTFSMDRRQSGEVGFNENFPAVTSTTIEGDGKEALHLRLLVDKSSIEAFGDGGRFAMTNQVFPSEPYKHIDFYGQGGTYKVESFVVYTLKP
jgi:fructan beta-fructosidase